VVRGGERLGDLDEDVQLVVHRVVQEALTNVLRHASARHVQVAIERSAGRLVVEVCDDGAGSPPAHGVRLGRGLAGMRERVALIGGDLDAGPLKDSGFRVLVSIPLGHR
jgi:signal transduction histidine kinase